MRYLIVNGDDFGLSAGVTRGILEAHRRGILTSTSFMVDRPFAEEAAALAREASELSVGLHLELEGPALDDARAAVERQLLRFEALTGRAPTHIDSHHDAHGHPGVLPHVLESGARLGIPVRSHSPVATFGSFYGDWGGESHPEHLSAENLIRMLATEVREGVTELICHPGHVAHDLDSSYRAMRERELETLCDARVRDAVDRQGIRLIGFRDLGAMLPDAAACKERRSW